MIEAVFDARMIAHSGIGAHIRGLLEGFRALETQPRLTLLGRRELLRQYDPCAQCPIQRFHSPIYSLREQVFFPYRKTRNKLLHVPHYNIPYFRKHPLVVTVHDLIHLLFADQFGGQLKLQYARLLFKRVKQCASRIIAVSRSTRDDLVNLLGVEAERIVVIPNAVGREFLPAADAEPLQAFRKKFELPETYLLAVGIDKPHKNFDRLVWAMIQLWKSRRLELPLVLAGSQNPAQSPYPALVEGLGAGRELLRVMPHLENGEMPQLYQCAHALIFPSLYEGFGLPALEAQSVGLPVAASNAAAIPEVTGKAALFFDPLDREDMADKICQIATDERLRRTLIDKGRENSLRFNWRESARRTLEVYQSVIE